MHQDIYMYSEHIDSIDDGKGDITCVFFSLFFALSSALDLCLLRISPCRAIVWYRMRAKKNSRIIRDSSRPARITLWSLTLCVCYGVCMCVCWCPPLCVIVCLHAFDCQTLKSYWIGDDASSNNRLLLKHSHPIDPNRLPTSPSHSIFGWKTTLSQTLIFKHFCHHNRK